VYTGGVGKRRRNRGYARWALVPVALAIPLALTLSGAGSGCIATSPEGLRRVTDDDAGSDAIDPFADADLPDAKGDLGSADPHAVFGAVPSHGPFNGGQRVLVSGNGFSSDVRVWFGEVEVDPATVVPIDPTRVQVSAPPGQAGSVDLTAQNGEDESTRRTLPGGYHYDALYAAPSSGPVAGGNEIEIFGQGTTWDGQTEARIGQQDCVTLTAVSPTELRCGVPKGAPGAQPVAVDDGGEVITVLDAYTYEDSADGFKGGLSGGPLAGELTVLVYDNFTGEAIPGAHVIAGDAIDTALIADVGASGVVVLSDPSLDQATTVTVAASCHSPITFVDVPVDTVTVYLDPVLTPACAGDGDPPPVGGSPGNAGIIRGELVWPSQQEFQKGGWDIPPPKTPDEKRRAYVFTAAQSPTQDFALPATVYAVTPEDPGQAGYQFLLSAAPGNRTLYALAGIEDRSVTPPKFYAYTMGVVSGVPVEPGKTTEDVYIGMYSHLDLALTLDVTAPAPGPKGPDRMRATVAVKLDSEGYAILPSAQKAPLLPLSGPITFVGVPLLANELLGASYLSTARAVTGPGFTSPMSVIGQLVATNTSQPIPVDGFVSIPTLVAPAINTQWDGRHLSTTFPPSGAPIDLSVYDISAGGGLWRWTIAVPAASHDVEVPDIRVYPDASLPAGPLTIAIYGAYIDGFNYGEIRFRNLRPQGMTAYALDTFNVHQ
jgi:hypothetical protein